MAEPNTGADKAPLDRGDKFVIVACKMPNGVVLNFNRYERMNETTADIRKIVDRRTITLKGWAHKVGEPPPVLIEGGYALTSGVPADLWDEWAKTHADSPLLEDRLIFAAPTSDRALKQAREQASVPKQFSPARPTDVPGVVVATDDKGKPLIKHNEKALIEA